MEKCAMRGTASAVRMALARGDAVWDRCAAIPLAIRRPRLRRYISSMLVAMTSSHVTNGAPQPRMDEEPVDRINRRHHYGQECRIKPSAHWRERRDPDLLLIDVHANGLYPCLKDFLDNVGHDGDRQLPSPSSQEAAW